MDLTQAVTYRGYNLNNAVVAAGIITGSQIDTIDYSNIASVGYREKRSLSDGLDASDVYLGARYIHLAGTIYGATREDVFDVLQDLRAALLATAALAESPTTLGYMPLAFSEPTADHVTWPTGFIAKQMYARPFNTPAIRIDRDHIGGDANRGFSVQWSVDMEARDPRIYLQTLNQTYFNAAGNTSSGSGSVTNRGPYPAPLDILIFVPAGTADRVVTLTAFGTVTKITVPSSPNDRTARYDGSEKILTLEEQGVQTLRMDLLEFPGALTHPLVPTGVSSYSWTCKNIAGTNANINASSRFWFAEAWV